MAIDVALLLSEDTRFDLTGGSTECEQRYWVGGTDDRIAAANAVISAAALSPLVRNGLATVIPDSVRVTDLTDDTWQASLTLKNAGDGGGFINGQPRQVGESTFSFDGAGGRVTIKTAYHQEKYGTNAPDHGLAIAVVDGVAEGTEITVPTLSFQITQKFHGPTITLPWLRSICLATGHVNSDFAWGFAPGELLFLGPTGSQPFAFFADGQVQFSETDLQFRFAVSPNLTDLAFGDITVPEKAGHDYLWRDVVREVDDPNNPRAVTEKTLGVYVAQVYPRMPFAALGLADPGLSFPVA